MKTGLLYSSLARYYDLIYSRKDYKKESALLRKLIRENKQSPGKDLLEVACGTGLYLAQFEKDFSCVGIDLNSEMLQIAKKRLKKTPLMQGNMLTFNLGTQFDVVLCLFSSIANLKNYRELQRTIKNIANHMKPGGVFILGPWQHPSYIQPEMPRLFTFDSPELKVARVDFPKQKGNKSILDFHWLIAEKGKPVKYIPGDHHELCAFTQDQYFESMQKVNLVPRFIQSEKPSAIGLYIGVKKSTS